jgi:uncharacterized membrane protein required for colicin V production
MIAAIQSAPLADLGILAVLFGFFIMGVMQGTIRMILAIIATSFSFLLSANLRGPLGDYLAGNWQQFPDGYNRMLAFLMLFLAMAIVSLVVIQGFYKRTELWAQNPIVDDIAGGVLGLVEGLVLLVVFVAILGSYMMPTHISGELDYLRSIHDALLYQSNIGTGFRQVVDPFLLHLLSGLLPGDLVAAFP